MDRRETPFKYRLSSLLKLDTWEGRLLGVELRRARAVLEERKRLLDEALQRIAAAEDQMRDMHRADAPLSLAKRQLLSTYLQAQYGEAQARGDAVAQAERLFDQIMTQRQAKQQRIRALENHADRERRAHVVEQLRADARESDDRWLNRRGDDR